MDLLKIVEARLSKFEPETWNTDTLILLDIARSLRTANELAKSGMEWSRSLADKLES